MTDVQEKLLDMLKWFHEFCEENQLAYYAVGGTALGAIRHNGFIPWDDDIDLGMPRDDYEKLKQLLKDHKGKYVLEDAEFSKEHVFPYIKIYDTSTSLIENKRNKIKRGIYIDLYPIDAVGNTEKESVSFYRSVENKFKLLNISICELRKGRAWYKNMAVLVAKIIPKAILNPHRLLKKIDTMSKSKKWSECIYVANLVGAWHEREIMEKGCFGKPTLHKFEDMQVCVPEHPETYLENLFGDYMTLPPEEKRVSHHDYIYVNLNESYIED